MDPTEPDWNAEALPDACAALLAFTDGDSYRVDTPLERLIVATFRRSTETLTSILILVEEHMPIQAAMLSRSLFEDLVVGHWLVFNGDDSEWLTDRFFRHRDAIALHQRKLEREHGWSMGPPIRPDGPDLRGRQNALVKEFGDGARRNWWDPGRSGRGSGGDIGISGVAGILEDAAADRVMFAPRFAGGDEALLRRWDSVVHKWLSQFIHHTAIGLPFVLEPDQLEVPAEPNDPSPLVLFAGFWMYAQQIYLLHDLYDRPTDEFDALFRECWLNLGAPLE